jgi:hypothetical protein
LPEPQKNAGIDCIILITLHRPEELGSNNNVLGVTEDYDNFALP